MKKLSLEMLRLTSDEVLHRSQMKKITGGYGTVSVYCHCTGSVGAWSGTYSSWDAVRAAVVANCASEAGYCR
jgi:natural product precursor